MIRCDDLVFGYPGSGFRLSIPELAIGTGEKVAVIGPSGSGKTSLLDLIAGVRLPIRGAVVVGGTTVSNLSEAQRRAFRLKNVGFVFQTFELFDYLTVRENILLPSAAAGFSKSERDSHNARFSELASSTDLQDKLDRKVSRLSRGEQQRVAVCRAILHRPSVVLADEPTGNLDPGNKMKAIQLLLGTVAGKSATLVAATHDESLLPFFDRVIDLSDLGRQA